MFKLEVAVSYSIAEAEQYYKLEEELQMKHNKLDAQ